MMQIRQWQTAGAVFTLVLGTLLHFTYEWFGKNPAMGLFSAVSESTWEHLKLLFVPMLVFGIAEYFLYGRSLPDFIAVRTVSIVFGMFLIVAVFYTYSGILGKNIMAADIATFFVGVIGAYVLSHKLLENGALSGRTAQAISVLVLAGLIGAFAVFTFFPPEFGMFRNPLA